MLPASYFWCLIAFIPSRPKIFISANALVVCSLLSVGFKKGEGLLITLLTVAEVFVTSIITVVLIDNQRAASRDRYDA
jgi:hypothetical protein